MGGLRSLPAACCGRGLCEHDLTGASTNQLAKSLVPSRHGGQGICQTQQRTSTRVEKQGAPRRSVRVFMLRRHRGGASQYFNAGARERC